MQQTRWGIVFLVFLGGLLAAAQFGKFALTLPQVAAVFDRSIPAVSVLVSLVGVVGLMCGVVAGSLAAAFGPGRTFLLGLLMGGALSLGQIALPPFAIMAGLRALEGAAHLALVVAGPPLMAWASSDRDRPLVMGLWAVFFGASLLLSAPLFPWLLSLGGFPLLFACHGMALWLLALVLWRSLPKTGGPWPNLEPLQMHLEIYRRLPLMAPGLGFTCYTFTFVASVALLPEALGRPELATRLPLVTLATTLLGGALCRRLPCYQVLALGYGGTVLGLAAALAGLPFALEAAFAFMGLIPGASFAAIPALNPGADDRTKATGAIAQLGNLGSVTGTPVLALVWSADGAQALLVALLLVCTLGGVLGVWAGRRALR